MPYFKNVTGQKIVVYAYDPSVSAGTDPSVTGDAANITAEISKDGGVSSATNDVNPTELEETDHPGVYVFDMTQDEMDADLIVVSAVSATSNVLIDPVVISTIEAVNTTGGIVETNIKQIDSDSSAAVNLKDAALRMVQFVVDDSAFTSTTTEFETNITEATANHWSTTRPRVILWTSGALVNQQVRITAYSLVGGKGHFTVDAMTEAPANTNTGIIV